ncbi:MAG: peptide-methionine (S)-S-oxide reductase MsrA [Candidatus Magasanikbacteria bacterium]
MQNIKKAYFAGGCFWGVQYYFQKLEGIIETTVGYMGGDKVEPTYQEICNENTGHLESLEVVYDADKTNFEILCKYFFEIHDPTQKNGQGSDIGEQYLSTVFFVDEEQKEITEKLINILKEKKYDVVTKILPATKFWPAENYHQKYYEKNGHEPYCHVYKKKF